MVQRVRVGSDSARAAVQWMCAGSVSVCGCALAVTARGSGAAGMHCQCGGVVDARWQVRVHLRTGRDSARAAPTSGGVSECAVDVREGCGYVFLTSLHHRVSGCLGVGRHTYRLGFTHTKKSVSILRVRG